MKKALNSLGFFGLCVACGAGLFIEFYYACKPCSLCFLQRLAFLGAAFGLYLNLCFGIKTRHYALSFLWALFGLFVSLRHMGLNLCQDRTTLFTVFSYHVYSWSFALFFLALVCLALLLLFEPKETQPFKRKQTFFGSILLSLLVLGILSVVRKMGIDF